MRARRLHMAAALLSLLAFARQGRAQSPLLDSLGALSASEDAAHWRASARRLAGLPLSDFGAAERAALMQLLRRAPIASTPDLLRIAGALGLAEPLRRMAGGVPLSRDVEQVRKVALVRAGDGERARVFEEAVLGLGVDEAFVREVLPTVLYARHRPTVDYLLAEMAVPNPSCTSLNPNVERELDCGYRLMEGLARVIEDFPVEASWDGGVEADDYPEALERSRAWARVHADTYTLNLDRL